MEKNEFYLSSLELVKERIENRLNEAENTAIENETESLFVWMLLQFHWKMEGNHQATKNCRIEFNGCNLGTLFGLRYSYIADYYIKYVRFYDDFVAVLNRVVRIFEQHKNYHVISFNIPKNHKSIEDLCIILEFSVTA